MRSKSLLAPRPGLEPGTCGLTVRHSDSYFYCFINCLYGGGWCFRPSSETVKKPGWRGYQLHLLSRSRDRPRKSPPTTPPSVDEESSGYDRRFECKLTPVCSTPAPLSLVKGDTSCKLQL